MIHTHTYAHLHTLLKMSWNWNISLPGCTKIFFWPLEIFSLQWKFFINSCKGNWYIHTPMHTYTHLYTPLKMTWNWNISLPGCTKIFFLPLEIEIYLFQVVRKYFFWPLEIFSLWWDFFLSTVLKEIDTYIHLWKWPEIEIFLFQDAKIFF